MRLVYGHLADYAAVGANGKPTLVGVFGVAFAPHPADAAARIALPRCFLVAALEASTAEGSDHDIEFRFVDADGEPTMPPIQARVRFSSGGPGRPLAVTFILELLAASVPSHGDYEFRIRASGQDVGAGIPLTVLEPPPQA